MGPPLLIREQNGNKSVDRGEKRKRETKDPWRGTRYIIHSLIIYILKTVNIEVLR
jgi:hypothetical protein